jgi:hypothetical protein
LQYGGVARNAPTPTNVFDSREIAPTDIITAISKITLKSQFRPSAAGIIQLFNMANHPSKTKFLIENSRVGVSKGAKSSPQK